MGQRHGKATYDSAARPFLNLSLAAVGTLWETFNDVADGFGINLYEFKEICAELEEELQLNRAKLDKVRVLCRLRYRWREEARGSPDSHLIAHSSIAAFSGPTSPRCLPQRKLLFTSQTDQVRESTVHASRCR